jgi:multidrug efflux pump subunit AcrB
VQGGDVRELEVVLDPDKLAAAHLLPSAVADRLAAEHTVDAVGRAREWKQVLTVLVSSQPATPEAIGALPVGQGTNGPILLNTVTQKIEEGAEDRTLTIAGPGGDVVVVSVSRALGASTPKVVDAARALVASLELPPGVKIEPVYDQSLLIHDAMDGVRDAILIGIGLSFLVLALFLRDLRAGICAAVAVPITLVATFGVMRLLGVTLNLMSLGGLAVAIGLIVDDAIVIVEAIVRRVEEGLPVPEAAARGTEDLFAAVVGTTFTTVVVFAPLALIQGVVGSFFGALATTLCAAVLLSLIVSVTLVPLLASKILRPRPARAHTGRVAGWYQRTIARTVRRPLIGIAVIILVAGAGVFASQQVKTGFLPTMDEGALVIDFFMPPGTSLEDTDRMARKLDNILGSTPAVATFTRRTGAEMGPAAATQQNRGDIMVRLVPRARRESVYDVIDDLRRRAQHDLPEARVEFLQVLQDALDDLSGNPSPIEVKIFGSDLHELAELGRAAAAKLDGVPNMVDLFNGVEGEVPTLQTSVLPVPAAALGASPQQIATDLEVALAGRVAGQVRREDRTIGVRVRFPDEVRFDPAHIQNMSLAYGGSAGPVPLTAVAKIERPVGPSLLLRENQRQMILMTAALSGGAADLGAATTEVQRRLDKLTVPSGYQLEVGGQIEGARQTRNDLAFVFGVGVILILAILVLQLRSLRMALVVLLGAPLALVGALITLLATGIPLNASSLMGCVLLAGLVVKNGILLLEQAQKELDAGAPDAAEALGRAGERRLRPILMTTAATIAGLVPLAFAWGAGSELQRPLAMATIGGLVLSTLVTLFAVPSLAYALRLRGRKDSQTV